MKNGITIRNFLFITMWIVIGGGMFTLLMAAISKKNKGTCRDYVISIRGEESNLFLSKQEIAALLEELAGGPVKGQPVAQFRLGDLEQKLEMNTWIEDVQMYFDNKDVLHISIVEKIPVARVFSSEGRSFYTDSIGSIMPLSAGKTARVPVFTGFPNKSNLSAKDSLLLKHIGQAGQFILNDPFWNAQVSQVDILPDRSFEMIPLVGDHRVKLGDGEEIAAKFRRLGLFYQQVLKRTGFNSYRQIDVQYKGQVVASRSASDRKVDSIQLRRNVEKLLAPQKEKDPNPVKTGSVSTEERKDSIKIPKAVMPQRREDEQQ